MVTGSSTLKFFLTSLVYVRFACGILRLLKVVVTIQWERSVAGIVKTTSSTSSTSSDDNSHRTQSKISSEQQQLRMGSQQTLGSNKSPDRAEKLSSNTTKDPSFQS